MNFSNFRDLWQRVPARGRTVAISCAYGLVAGAAAVAFQLGINWVYQLGLVRLSQDSKMVFALGSLAVITVSSVIVGWLMQTFGADAAGSGIPQLKLAFWKDFGCVPWRVAWLKFAAGILSVGGGASLGREGPSVQIAGTLASNVAGLAGEAKQNRRTAAAAGAAAGLAAAFNAPLAATTFVLEEIIGDLNSRLLGSVLLASVLGALVVHGIIGRQPSFRLQAVEAPTWLGYLFTPVVAALAGVVGVYFQRLSLDLRLRLKAHPEIPRWLLPLIGGLITWVLGVSVFWHTGRLGIFSLGYDDLSSALAGDVGWQLAALLLAAKFVATFSCYGCGGCGGIFSPTLFFGAMVGVVIAGLLNLEFAVSRGDCLTLAVVGMSACLGAVVWAPVTGILIVFEMTQKFALVPALMLGALVSQTIARRLNRHNFYDAVLDQDGHRIEHVRPPRDLKSWEQMPVSAIANFAPVLATSLGETALQPLLAAHPYRQFPVVLDGKLAGVLTREDATRAWREKQPVKLRPATVCLRDATIRKLQQLLIDSDTQLVLLQDRAEGQVVGLVTLHDLLRAQTEMTQRSKEEVA
jgi:CIC family chloride channel protein